MSYKGIRGSTTINGIIIVLVLLAIAYYFCLPNTLFSAPSATVIQSRDGHLLSARIAEDQQWRFPEIDSVPYKFKTCILEFEDAYFYYHPGYNPASMVKAMLSNIKAGKIVRGGSTLTQQVIRLSREGKRRTYFEKFIELILATRAELRYSKDELLNLYASHAPFGGNVVGLEMASWRYFGLSSDQLSWAESATLAVLPNAPALIYPGKNKSALRKKRDLLLTKLYENQKIDSLTYQLALTEPLPDKPFALPHIAPHLLQEVALKNSGHKVSSTIDYQLQLQVNNLVKGHYEQLKQNGVFNAAVMVMDIESREVLAYVGNSPTSRAHQKDVDIIKAPRSTGSLLKPFLYAAMLNNGTLLPESLVADVPTQISGYRPENYSQQYAGAVPARQALIQSLNVPAVRLLQSYGLEKFHAELRGLRQGFIDKPANYYGLSLILGGAESSLWDLCKAYAGMASTVNHYTQTSSEYYDNEFIDPIIILGKEANFGTLSQQPPLFDAGSLFQTLEALKQVNRPDGEQAWMYYKDARPVAWKTGTSFGNRDAWAIGVTSKYLVGVWVGNADGEGRPMTTGVGSAAPLMFDVFNTLPQHPWFDTPYDALTEISVCANSGYLASPICPVEVRQAPLAGIRFKVCPYHRLIHLDENKQFQVNSSCYPMEKMITSPWFVLPSLMAYYYKATNPYYESLPPLKSDCQGNLAIEPFEFIYPKDQSKIVLTKSLSGRTNELVCKIAHSDSNATLYWYLDDAFIGETKYFHEMAILPSEGEHRITLVDSYGNEASIQIEIQKTDEIH
ncbi:penicillin-binding protein 1C [Galbibacter sp.]|uniref:penicillin-binding protein 1C n=1 Tax=Galbibacter sp. TaxID=2918471 RepID=UPI003A944DD2